jgi:hypothetical protein
VEDLALEYYASAEGGSWYGTHTEGGVWTTLAGLLLWDCLFAAGVPDVLRTPFQTAPLDLEHGDAFYPARRQQVCGARRGEPCLVACANPRSCRHYHLQALGLDPCLPFVVLSVLRVVQGMRLRLLGLATWRAAALSCRAVPLCPPTSVPHSPFAGPDRRTAGGGGHR